MENSRVDTPNTTVGSIVFNHNDQCSSGTCISPKEIQFNLMQKALEEIVIMKGSCTCSAMTCPLCQAKAIARKGLGV